MRIILEEMQLGAAEFLNFLASANKEFPVHVFDLTSGMSLSSLRSS